MKKMILILFSLFLLCLCVGIAFSKPQKEIIQPTELEKVIEQHPLVEKAEIYEVFRGTYWDAIFKPKSAMKKLPYTFDLDLTLTNGHTVTFKEIPNDLTFYKDGALHHINDVYFAYDEHKSNGKVEGFSRIYLRDLCKATDTNYYDLYTILDNYNEFCKVLNSISWRLDKDAEKLCAKYSEKHYVYRIGGLGFRTRKLNL